MLIPFGHQPTMKERHQQAFRSRLQKAVHLSERMRLLLNDVDDSNFSKSEKRKLRDAALEFLSDSSAPIRPDEADTETT